MAREVAPICYVELPAPELERAGVFYRDVFGWSIQPSELTDEPYWAFTAGQGRLSGALDPRRAVDRGGGGVLLYLWVTDIHATLEAVVRGGGRIVRAKAPIGGGHGHSAQFTDPCGNLLGLCAAS